jgi:hypothetical protein
MTPKKEVLLVAGGGSLKLDLWSTVHARAGTSAADAARVVAGELEVWDVIGPLGGQALNVGQLGGASSEGDAIVTWKTRARTVLVALDGAQAVAVHENRDGTIRSEPHAIEAMGRRLTAPFGERVWRVAWACTSQPLRLGDHDRLPAPVAGVKLHPTAPANEIVFWLAMWVG